MLVTYKVLHDRAPIYIQELLQLYTPSRNLRSSNRNLLVKQMAVASMRQDEAVASSSFWPFFFRRNFSSLRRLKTWSRTRMANARLNWLALAYFHKPTETDSSSVLKRWDASGHRRNALAFRKE